jgi:hypothetical protein
LNQRQPGKTDQRHHQDRGWRSDRFRGDVPEDQFEAALNGATKPSTAGIIPRAGACP